jgi:hypothetical protein
MQMIERVGLLRWSGARRAAAKTPSIKRNGLRRMDVGRIGVVEGGPLFKRELTDKFHDAFFDDVGFNADP